MDDNRIIELFFCRDEQAIELTKSKYGRYLNTVAFNILGNRSASEECESDTYYRAWNSIPPARPVSMLAYLSKITRNLALDKLREEKRAQSLRATVILDEISEILPDTSADLVYDLDLKEIMRDFVRELDPTSRNIFLKRYFYMMTVREIAFDLGIREGSVKSSLFRTRQKLRDYLKRRGVEI